MKDKEKVYDEEISPLIDKIIDICKRHDMPFFTMFQYCNTHFCSSCGRLGGHVVFDYQNVLRQCCEKKGMNIDKFMFWVMGGAREEGHTSIVLGRLGISEAGEK